MDDTFLVLPGVEVRLSGAGVERSVTSGSDGCYELTSVERGTYTLSAHEHTLLSQGRRVTVGDDLTLIFDFALRLKPGMIREPPLIVQGQPADAPTDITGCVTDAAGRPQRSVEVEIAGTATTRATTDRSGCFRSVVAPGRYRIQARAGALESQEEGPMALAAGSRLRCPALVLMPKDRR